MGKTPVAIIGSGNIGTDLMIKIERSSEVLSVAAMVGVDQNSDGLKRAARLGKVTSHEGVEGLIGLPEFRDIQIVFDASSASAHIENFETLKPFGKKVIDLTPCAIGPYLVPSVNIENLWEAENVNMVTCGGQATIPIVAAIRECAEVHYAEIVASIASLSAGPGTRANIDEFTETTARAIERVGGAARGKAIITLNPADPPIIMRDTVFCLCDDVAEDKVLRSIENMVAQVSGYVPGYRLKQNVQFTRISPNSPISIPDHGHFSGLKISIFLEVEGAGHYLPAFAGNLDIMTSAAMQTAELFATRL